MTPSPDSESQALPDTAAAPAAAVRPLPTLGWPLWLAWAVAALALMSVFMLWQKLNGMQEQLARQSQEAGRQAIEARTLASQAELQTREFAGRMAALNERVNDLLTYRNQVDALVQAVVRGRDENLVLELEAGLRLAQDQAQLTGAVQPLLAVLRSAERRLDSGTDARLDEVRNAVAVDLERLRRLSGPSTASLLTRIDQLLGQVDSLPMASSVGAELGVGQPGELAPGGTDQAWWQRWRSAVAKETHRLLRVSRVDHPEAALLSPEQAYFVRENLKLRLLAARLAVLARQHNAAQADLALAAQMLRQWFEPQARRTRQATDLLQRVQADNRAAVLPSVDATLQALEQAAALVLN